MAWVLNDPLYISVDLKVIAIARIVGVWHVSEGYSTEEGKTKQNSIFSVKTFRKLFFSPVYEAMETERNGQPAPRG